ncbi:DUF1365 domain-containing protein [Rhodococcoides kyotonense]|uniref:DUF1365 domain-containing protein n=1 Tax=Rhodococcoides kyotonense TaxID=398843 RepID=A0A239LR18_9NOCA|nr:DUF1365 domain-containing protein [Rhodococcus kyotonensis]SNT32911.1 hypothetical protein SAMN05421642_11431 [Rhodococcus kyotonensis]
MDVNAIYSTTIEHVRTAPLRNRFRYRSYSWFVDLDDMPQFPSWARPLAVFDARDHVGDPARSIRANIDHFLADHDIDLDGGRITMLANARVFGHTFNPLSVFWCHDRQGRLVCVVAEVHNTYGERYAYLLHTDERGSARARKEFYVSPFNDVDGDYRMRLPEPDDSLRLSIVLERDDAPPFVATVSGTRRRASTRALIRSALTVPLAPLRVVVQIRLQGIRLWARGLPIRPRPHAPVTGKASR